MCIALTGRTAECGEIIANSSGNARRDVVDVEPLQRLEHVGAINSPITVIIEHSEGARD